MAWIWVLYFVCSLDIRVLMGKELSVGALLVKMGFVGNCDFFVRFGGQEL